MEMTPKNWLFVINRKAGISTVDYQSQISEYFEGRNQKVSFFTIEGYCDPADLRKLIMEQMPPKVIAVGGDGTLKLVAESILDLPIELGIIPGGSANGLAFELGIPTHLIPALEIIETGKSIQIHVLRVNDNLCIHLADIGLNAFMVQKFEQNQKRGMWGYILAAVKTFSKRYRMQLELEMDGQKIQFHAFMLVLANATRYGTGAWINPIGSLEDSLFEVVVIRKISLWDGLRLALGLKTYEPKAIRVLQTKFLKLKSRKPVHFQVDGEYLGKVKELNVSLYPSALRVLVPA